MQVIFCTSLNVFIANILICLGKAIYEIIENKLWLNSFITNKASESKMLVETRSTCPACVLLKRYFVKLETCHRKASMINLFLQENLGHYSCNFTKEDAITDVFL